MNTRSLERLRLHIVALETDNRALRKAVETAACLHIIDQQNMREMSGRLVAAKYHQQLDSDPQSQPFSGNEIDFAQAGIRASQTALASSRAEAILGRADLLASEAALASSRAETLVGRGDLLASEAALASSRAETKSGRGDLLTSENALASSRAETLVGRGDLLASEAALASSRAETLVGRGDLLASEAALATSRAETLVGRGDLLASEAALASSRAETKSGRGDLLTSENALASSRAETMLGRDDLLASEAALASSRAETMVGRGDLLTSENALASSRAETLVGRGDLLASEAALASSRAETLVGRGDLLASEAALATSRAETKSGRGDLLTSENALASSRAETMLGRGDLLASEAALASSRAETKSGRGDLLTSENALASSRAETMLGRDDLLASEAALASSRAETMSGRGDLLASEAALASSRAETMVGRGDLLASEAALASSRAETMVGQADLLASEAALASSRAETIVGRDDLLTSENALASSRAETIVGRGDLLTSENALASSRAETMVGRGDLLTSENALASSRAETMVGRGDLLASEAALASSRAETMVGQADLLASEAALASARAETMVGRGDLLTSENALASSRAETISGRSDLLASETALTSLRAETQLGHADLLASQAANIDLDILARELQHLAYHDPLTDLPNRSLLRDRLTHAIEVAARSGNCLALFCLDLDRFKIVNDVFGHSTGDALLIQATERLQQKVRVSDTLARVGGDEFVVVATFDRDEQIPFLAERLINALAEPFILEVGPVEIGVSIGIAIYPEDGINQQELMRTADVALYRAKQEGRNTYRFFETEMDEHARLRHRLERDLRNAIERDELSLHYQPLIDSLTGEVDGFEALLRWNHPERGMILPLDFIALAEETGLILKIGQWVLETACAAAALWTEPHSIAVNISPVQFVKSDLGAIITRTLAQTGLCADRLEIEITEGILMADPVRAAEVLTTLRGLGVRIAMDDFGKGYSSLSYLHEFKFDKLKIDRSFVSRLPDAEDAIMIVRTIIGLAHNLGLLVVAEGVETIGQLKILRDLKCDQIQGYLFGRPMQMDGITPLIATRGRMLVTNSLSAETGDKIINPTVHG